MRTFSIRFFFSALLITVMLPGCTPKEGPTSLTVANSDTSVYLAGSSGDRLRNLESRI